MRDAANKKTKKETDADEEITSLAEVIIIIIITKIATINLSCSIQHSSVPRLLGAAALR